MGVNTDVALDRLKTIPVSLHCWQGDDLRGFENPDADLTGGIATTGDYPGRARNACELRSDLDLVYKLTPGTHRLALHGLYAETGALLRMGGLGAGEQPRAGHEPISLLPPHG